MFDKILIVIISMFCKDMQKSPALISKGPYRPWRSFWSATCFRTMFSYLTYFVLASKVGKFSCVSAKNRMHKCGPNSSFTLIRDTSRYANGSKLGNGINAGSTQRWQ